MLHDLSAPALILCRLILAESSLLSLRNSGSFHGYEDFCGIE
jgi:hypothetical protein